jgi:hypothetical protein
MPKETVISNSSLNSYGFRVLTSGIDLTQYQRNPILLWMHSRAIWGRTDDVLPLGRMENLRVDGDNLIGTPVFDENDEFARKIKAKWESGILKMVSAGLRVIDESDDPAVLVQGQRYATVTKCKLLEVSIVDIGANDDAIVLYDDQDRRINLSQGDNGVCLTPINNQNIHLNTNEMELKQIALALGLAESATEQEVLARAGQLCKDAGEVAKLRKAAEEQQNEALAALVDSAVSEGRFAADKRNHFLELGKKVGLKALQETIDLMKPAQRPSTVINPANPGSGEYKKLSDVPADKLEALRSQQPDKYKQLYQAEYGFEPMMKD